MRNLAVLALLALIAPAVAQFDPSLRAGGCLSVSGPAGYVTLRWYGLKVYANYIEFVPYRGGIAALVIFGPPGPMGPIQTEASACPPRSMDLLGWYWNQRTFQLTDTVALNGFLNGGGWTSPPVNAPIGFVIPSPPLAMPTSLGQTYLGVMIWRVRRGWSSVDSSAYLMAPTTGSW